MNKLQLSLYRNLQIELVLYGTGYDDDVKVEKTKVLNELMKITLESKSSSNVVSCDTIIQLLKQRKDFIDNG